MKILGGGKLGGVNQDSVDCWAGSFTYGRVAIESEESDICSRWRSNRDMAVGLFVADGVEVVWISRRVNRAVFCGVVD